MEGSLGRSIFCVDVTCLIESHGGARREDLVDVIRRVLQTCAAGNIAFTVAVGVIVVATATADG